jgi:hypothetical protein
MTKGQSLWRRGRDLCDQSCVLQQQGYALWEQGVLLRDKSRRLLTQGTKLWPQGLRLLDKADKLCPLHYWLVTTDNIQTVRLK